MLDLVNYRIAFSRLACCLAYKPRKFARLLFCFAVNNDFIVFCFYPVFAFAFPELGIRQIRSLVHWHLVLFSSVIKIEEAFVPKRVRFNRCLQNNRTVFIIAITLLQNNLCSIYNSCCWAIFSSFALTFRS